MTENERFLRTMRYEPVDRRPLHLVGPWFDTLARWHTEGLPGDVTDVNAYLGLTPLRVVNVTGTAGLHPAFEQKVLSEDDTTVTSIDLYGRTVRNFKYQTSFPEWIDFPVKTGDDLWRLLDEHFDVSDMDSRFDAAWEERVRVATSTDCVVMLDAGCYYWTLRSLAGIEGASYLLYDAPDAVEELFERYLAVVMEGLRRLPSLVTIDVMGFGEDIAGKNGPFMSPALFRSMILPRYKKAMERAHEIGVEFTWHDSDGDLRLLLPDYLSIGINGVGPCEVAAGMDPVELRRQFGRDLRMVGGFDKRVVAQGPAAIDAEFERLRPVIVEGGYLPSIDHSVSADISFDNYRYFTDAVQRAILISQ
ncbi:MAG TPA: uroporphyrinogen decarboxylase family protein [Capsulimonadaceae bacterium]|jgi:uroporphyrinogen decarboxylase